MNKIEYYIKNPELEERLLKEEHIVKIIPAESWNIPQINPSLWERKWQEYSEICIRSMERYLNLPYIIDDLSPHTNRHSYMDGLYEKDAVLADYYKENALRLNSIGVDNVICGYRGHTKKLKELLKLLYNDIKNYDKRANERTTDKKMEECKILKRDVYNILNFLSQDKVPFYKRFLLFGSNENKQRGK